MLEKRKSRKQRQLLKKREDRLGIRSQFGFLDLTPLKAIRNIIVDQDKAAK